MQTVEIHEANINVYDNLGNLLFTIEIEDDQVQILNSSGFISFKDAAEALQQMLEVINLLGAIPQ